MPRPVSKLIAQCFVIVLCTLAAFVSGSAQVAPKATDKPAESKPAAPRRPRPRTRPPTTSTIPASTDSYNFLDLGDRFRQDRKWNAAEAAYKEAIKAWPGNADALLELGFLYLDRNKLPEAQGVHSKLRAVNSSFAAELLADINRYKAASR